MNYSTGDTGTDGESQKTDPTWLGGGDNKDE